MAGSSTSAVPRQHHIKSVAAFLNVELVPVKAVSRPSAASKPPADQVVRSILPSVEVYVVIVQLPNASEGVKGSCRKRLERPRYIRKTQSVLTTLFFPRF